VIGVGVIAARVLGPMHNTIMHQRVQRITMSHALPKGGGYSKAWADATLEITALFGSERQGTTRLPSGDRSV
jgi:hypothetical protein